MAIQQMLFGGEKEVHRYWYDVTGAGSGAVTKQELPINGANRSGLAAGWGHGINKFDGLAIKISGTGNWKMIYMSHGSISSSANAGTTINPTLLIKDGDTLAGTTLYSKQANYVVGNDTQNPFSYGMIEMPATDDNGNGIPTLNRGSWYTVGTLAPASYGLSVAYRNVQLPNYSGGVSTKTFTHEGSTVTISLKKNGYPSPYNTWWNGTDQSNGGAMMCWGFEID